MKNIELFCDRIMLSATIEAMITNGIKPKKEQIERIVGILKLLIPLAEADSQLQATIEDNLDNILDYIEIKYGLQKIDVLN